MPGITHVVLLACYARGDTFAQVMANLNAVGNAAATFRGTCFAGLELEWIKAMNSGFPTMYGSDMNAMTPDGLVAAGFTNLGNIDG